MKNLVIALLLLTTTIYAGEYSKNYGEAVSYSYTEETYDDCSDDPGFEFVQNVTREMLYRMSLWKSSSVVYIKSRLKTPFIFPNEIRVTGNKNEADFKIVATKKIRDKKYSVKETVYIYLYKKDKLLVKYYYHINQKMRRKTRPWSIFLRTYHTYITNDDVDKL